MHDPWPHRVELEDQVFETPLPAVRLDRLRILASQAVSEQGALTAAWRPCLTGPVHRKVLAALRAAGAVGFSCGRLHIAESLQRDGEASVTLTRPPVIGSGPANLARLARTMRVAVVCEHFAQAEPIAQACTAAGSTVDVLVHLDSGRHRLGVRPGPDLSDLLEGLLTLQSITPIGLSTASGLAHTGRSAELSGEQLLHLIKAGQRSFARVGCDLKMVSLGGSGSVDSLNDVSIESRRWLPASYDAPFALIAGVIGRPTRDLAVIDAGSWELGGSNRGQPIAAGVVIEQVTADAAVLRLEPGAQDLLIGDLVAVPGLKLPCVTTQSVLLGDEGQWRVAEMMSN